MVAPSHYDILKDQYVGHINAAATYTALIAEMHVFLRNEMPEADAPDFLVRMRAATGTDLSAFVPKGTTRREDITGEGGGTSLRTLTSLWNDENTAANALLEPLFFADSQRFFDEFGAGAAELQFRTAPGTGGAAEPFSFKFLPNGTVVRTNKATGEIEIVGNFPDLVTAGAPPPTIMQNDAGDLVAVSPSGQVRVIQKGFGFAQIDPERTFALEALRTDVAFKGLELTARSNEIQAIGQDMANRIAIGRMELEEGQLNLNRITDAFEVRRKEREVALSFAVKATSIRTLPSGERVTRLPFAEQIAGILGIPIEEFELPVGSVNPDAAGQAVLDASAVDSPIPGLEAAADEAAAAISDINAPPLLGAPDG